VNGDHGDVGFSKDVELDDDMRFSPYTFDQLTVNAAAIERQSGLVTSIFSETWQKTRGVEQLRIVSHIGCMTVVWCPSRS